MGLPREYVNVAFSGGIDEDANPSVVSQPFLKAADNVYMDKRGTLKVRDWRPTEASAGSVSNPRMHNFRDAIFVTTDTGYALFNTSESEYREVGTLPRGYKSTFVGANDGGSGSHRGRISKTPIANHVFSAYMQVDNNLNSVLHMRVQDGVTGEVVWSDSIDDHMVLDVDYNESDSTICVLTAPAGGPLAVGAPDKGFGMVFVSESSGAYSYVHEQSSGPTDISSGAYQNVRQGQIAAATGSRVYFIINYMPDHAYGTWGATYCGWFTVGSSSITLIQACDGTTATRDGSGMVAVGIDDSEAEASQAIFMTCSKIDSKVYMWRISSGTTLSAQTEIKDVFKSYGPVTQCNGLDDIPVVWNEASVSPAAEKRAVAPAPGRPTEGGGSSLMVSLFAHGHNFMYGSITAQGAGGDLLVAWHGIAYHQALRQISTGAYTDHHMTAGTVLCSVSRSGDTFTLEDEQYAHSTLLLGKPVEVSAGTFHIPTAVAARWFVNLTDRYANAGPGQGFLQLRLQGDTDDDRIDLFQGQGTLQYSAGNVVQVVMNDPLEVEAVGTFGHDNVMPHTSPYWTDWMGDAYPTDNFPTTGWLDSDGYRVSDQYAWRKFDIHTSGSAVLDDGALVVGCTSWSNQAVATPYDGPRSFDSAPVSPEHQMLDWNASARRVGPVGQLSHGFMRLDTPTVSATSTPEYGLIDAGSLHVFDGIALFPLDWYVPPQPMLMQFEAYRGDRDTDEPKTHKTALCWAYKDAKGVMWRSAPSFTQINVCKRWRMEAVSGPPAEPIDIVLDVVGRPPPMPASLEGKLMLEYYTNSSQDPSQSGNSLEGEEDVYLFGAAATNRWVSGGKPIGAATGDGDWYDIFGLSIAWTLAQTKQTPVLLYTTGGVLASEPPNLRSGMTYAAGRVWYAHEGHAYYSKQIREGSPVGFNANLFVQSPAGDPIVGVAAMDEYVVLLTKNGVFVAEGQGPNDLGRGGAFSPYNVSSPVGCWNADGILSTHLGVFFPGPDTMYLLKRDMQVVRIGNIEDSVDPSTINYAVHHPNLRLFMWNVGTAPASLYLVFDYENGWWGRWTGDDVASNVTAVVSDGTLFSMDTDGTIRAESSTVLRPVATVRTGWIHFDRLADYKRFVNHYLVGQFSDPGGGSPGSVQIRYYYDYSDTPAETRTYNVADLSSGTEILRHKPSRQKCAAMSIEVICSATDATLSHMAAEVAVKRGPGLKTSRD